jgi:hypothetical protein
MGLRHAGAITARREGRFVYYRLANIKLFDLIHLANELLGVSETECTNKPAIADASCPCPKCSGMARLGEPTGNETVILAENH